MADFYEVLGVPKDASADVIRKSYRKLAVKWHPDKNPENQAEATEKFKLIAEAYEVLGDQAKRDEYDRRGTYGAYEDSSPRHPFRSRSRFSEQHAFDIFNAFFADMDDFHRDIFEGHGFGGNRRAEDRRSNGRNRQGDGPFSGFGGFGGFGGYGGFGISSLMDDFFGGGDPFADMGGMGGGGFSSTSFSSTSSSGGMRGVSRSVSTSTVIGPDGRRVTKKTTTIVHPDGRQETNTEETTDHVGSGRERLSYQQPHRQALPQSHSGALQRAPSQSAKTLSTPASSSSARMDRSARSHQSLPRNFQYKSEGDYDYY